MFLTASKNNGADLLLDTTLSFEARSLYVLIESLSGNSDDVYAPSLTVLAVTTNWTRNQVRRILGELVERRLVQELAGHDERYVIRGYQTKGDMGPAPTHVFSRPAAQTMASANSFRNLLSQEEISALVNGFN